MKKRLFLSFLITLLFYCAIFLSLLLHPKSETFSKRTSSALSLASVRIRKYSPPKRVVSKPKRVMQKRARVAKKRKPKKRVIKRRDHKVFAKKKLKKIFAKKRVAKKERNTSKANPPSMPSLAQLFKASPTPHKNDLAKLPAPFRKLYKDDFNSFTKAQKEFIKSNISQIGAITQKYLYLRGYPYIAIKTKQQGLNAVQFYLHPNGDISGLKLIQSSGYEALDKNSIETIKVAYKDYPRPKEKTKIKIFIHYRIIY